MNKKLNIVLLIAIIGLSIFTCSERDGQKLLRDSNNKLKSKIDNSENREEVLNGSILELRDSIINIEIQKDSLISLRGKNRLTQGALIRKAIELTESEGDSALGARNLSGKEINIELVKFDALKIDFRSLSDIYKVQQYEVLKKNRLIDVQEKVIQEKDLQLLAKDGLIENKVIEIGIEKKKKRKMLYKGFGIGFGVGAIAILLLSK